ncbi:MAG: glycosyltransferase family 39 protein [Alphaproteobacteria bacterium]|nr:glycosyltransferase family 39 protein [Alphaproteobacteria bacterium]
MHKKQQTYISQYIIWILLITSAILHFYKLGSIPSDINQDEALTAYNAFSLLTTGKSAFNNTNPIYLIGWGSGTSILYALLTKLCFFLFDISIYTARLPNAIMGTISCYVFYRLLRLFYNKQTALIGLFLIVISPWNIMTSRWGLDANIAPSINLISFYFYCKSTKKSQYLYLSSIFYALTIYSYATYWPYLAIIYPIQLIYLYKTSKTNQTTQNILYSFALFILLISPILYFILVNYNILNEVKLSWITIPKLPAWRIDELGITDIKTKALMLFNILIKQNDGWPSNMLPNYGLFYLFSPIFIITGLYFLFNNTKSDYKNKKFSFSFIVLTQIIVGIIYSLFLYSFSNRINFLYIPFLISLTITIQKLVTYKRVFYTIIAIYILHFIFFIHNYFTHYNQKLAQNYLFSFSYGIKDALQKAEEWHHKTNKSIYILGEPYIYPKVLFLNKIPPYIYQKTVTWYNYPSAFMQAKSFTYYHFINTPSEIPDNQIYITHTNQKDYFNTYTTFIYGNYIVATKE